MSLHGCEHSFEELALDVFPVHFASLINSLRRPLSLRIFLDNSVLIPTLPGCYVISQQETPIYVGIAKNMRRRIQDHLSGDPSRANLAVRMAAKEVGVKLLAIKKHPQFVPTFESAKNNLLNCGVSWVDIENPLEMYIFEAYCAMKLNTCEYNFFDTLQILHPKNIRGHNTVEPTR